MQFFTCLGKITSLLHVYTQKLCEFTEYAIFYPAKIAFFTRKPAQGRNAEFKILGGGGGEKKRILGQNNLTLHTFQPSKSRNRKVVDFNKIRRIQVKFVGTKSTPQVSNRLGSCNKYDFLMLRVIRMPSKSN